MRPSLRELPRLSVRPSVTALYPTSLFAYASSSGTSRSNGSETRESDRCAGAFSAFAVGTAVVGVVANDCGRVGPGEPQDDGKLRLSELLVLLVLDMRWGWCEGDEGESWGAPVCGGRGMDRRVVLSGGGCCGAMPSRGCDVGAGPLGSSGLVDSLRLCPRLNMPAMPRPGLFPPPKRGECMLPGEPADTKPESPEPLCLCPPLLLAMEGAVLVISGTLACVRMCGSASSEYTLLVESVDWRFMCADCLAVAMSGSAKGLCSGSGSAKGSCAMEEVRRWVREGESGEDFLSGDRKAPAAAAAPAMPPAARAAPPSGVN